MSLQNWLNNGWLTEHRTSLQEITALLAVTDRDLSDCKTSGLSPDWQLNKERVNLASRLRQDVEEWLHENHPDLMEE